MSDFPSISKLLPKRDDDKSEEKKVDEKTATFEKKIEEIGLKQAEKEVIKKATRVGIPHINLASFPISSEALKVISEEEARENSLICFYHSQEEIRFGCLEYTKEIEEIVHQIGERLHSNVKIYLISKHSLDKIFELYQTLPKIKAISKDLIITDEALQKYQEQITDFRNLSKHFENVSITDILTLMIAAALKVEASDVHVEAEEKGIVLRYRIDGVLQDIAQLPKELWKKFISRIKLLAALKININDRPQDGRVTLRLSEGSLDVRVSTMPTIYGESVVMRILYSGGKQVTFDDLGLRGSAYEQLKNEVLRPNGMIITTGPTGSGKTTTMYAILKLLNKPGVKIITMEDPVEIKMEGINQSQIDSSKGYTFAKGLKSILRQDPDICMVGEIRDLETAEISIQAALTGHLILSTIHTNSASGAIPRFMSMGVKPFLLAPALNSVIGQRLVRRICPKCIEEDVLDQEMSERVNKIMAKLPESEKAKIDINNMRFYKGKGCEHCSGLGYKGRIGIYEIFVMNKEIEQVILGAQVSEYKIEELAQTNGMVTMVQDGLLKALDKITSVEDIFRVIE